MISPAKAMELIRRYAVKAKIHRALLGECFGAVLAADIRAPFPMPVADNSAMDGFVIRSKDVGPASAKNPARLKIIGTLKAGDSKQIPIVSGTACRIMTGAFIPQGGDCVIAKEDAVIAGNDLVVDHPLREGQHIRRCGEETGKGQKLLTKGAILHPAQVGILATFGLARVPVYRKPKVSVLATGSELLAPGKKLSQGKVYDSNSWMIRAALEQMGIDPFCVLTLRDDSCKVKRAVRDALRKSDYLLLLGGVSVGDYDVVKDALKQSGVKTVFWKVSQKPGKPLFFGRKDMKIIFGLPGNPAAAFTCFYEYVYPALRQTMGFVRPGLEEKTVKVSGRILRDSKRHLFLKAKMEAQTIWIQPKARILSHQGSHMLSSLAEADGFLRIPAGRGNASNKKGFQMDFLPYKAGGAKDMK